jgi:hypothetical protein
MNRPSWTDPSNYRPSCWLLFTLAVAAVVAVIVRFTVGS